VKNAKERLGWEPKTAIDDALRKTLDFYLVEDREKIEHLL
jgi:nucleoside-diphosphate-sugar epimerase